VLALLYLFPIVLVHRERALAAQARSMDAHRCGTDHSGHHRPAQTGDHALGRTRCAGTLGRRRGARRRPDFRMRDA